MAWAKPHSTRQYWMKLRTCGAQVLGLARCGRGGLDVALAGRVSFDGEADGVGRCFTAGVLVAKLLMDRAGVVAAAETQLEGLAESAEGESLGAARVVVVDERAGLVVEPAGVGHGAASGRDVV